MGEIEQAIQYIKSGEKAKGREILVEVIRSDPNNEMAWLWMATVVEGRERKQECLERVLQINPNNAPALALSSKLKAGAAPEKIDKYTLQAKLQAIREEQNLPMGIVGGIIGGGIGAVLWAIITYITGYQIGWMAVGVSFSVGFGIRLLGKGIDKVFGIAGGVIALGSVILGNFLVSLGFLAKVLEVGYAQILIGFNYSKTLELMTTTFSLMDVLFYAIAIYEGYRYSFRKIKREDLLQGNAY